MEAQTFMTEVAGTPRLCQGVVVEATGCCLRLALPEGEREAVMALAYPYAPAMGDVLLVMTQDGDCYVVGVLQGRGRTLFQTPGDLEITAGGRVQIQGAEVALQGHKVSLRADRFESTVRVVVERCLSAYRWVKDAMHLNLGRSRTVVREESVLRAGRIRQSAREDVSINGEQVKLG